ncbi:MAG: hypothetical protein ABRQ34_12670 [Smithellaceae bacterium]
MYNTPDAILADAAEPVPHWRGLRVVAEADTLNATWYKELKISFLVPDHAGY